MVRQFFLSLLMCAAPLAAQPLAEQPHADWYPIIGSSYIDNASYRFLQRLCDETGGRLSGSPENERALGILSEEMAAHDCRVTLERYRFPGVVRGNDEVTMLTPLRRTLRAVPLGYVVATPEFEAPLVYAKQGTAEQYAGLDATGKVVLVTSEHSDMLRSEAIAIAAAHGARAVLFIRESPGGTTMIGMSNFHGDPSPIPAYSLTFEEGSWLRRLYERGVSVRMSVTTRTTMREMESANAVVTFPGASRRKIVIGAHFDGWDVGQAAVDNGVGTAILFDVARLARTFFPRNACTIECVWFNGEELGLWGAKRYVERHAADSIIAMINLDMTGTPTGFDAMGTDTLLPFLHDIALSLGGYDLNPDIGNGMWTNSDHEPFMLHGIPTIGVHGRLEPDMDKHYHDFGDTFDKVSKRYLCDASAVVAVLAKELANAPGLGLKKRADEETIRLLRKNKLEEKLKKQKEWIFD